jgi:group I intron endonuclease
MLLWDMASVYLITNTVNGKRYVGFTSQPMRLRWAQHTYGSRSGSGQPFHKALAKYGPEAFDFRVLYTGLTAEFALALEAAAITSLGTLAPAGYNLTTGGEHFEHTEASKQKLSLSAMGRKASPETRAKMSATWSGRARGPASEAAKANMSAAQRGKPGRPCTEESRAKISAAKVGKPRSEETRAKMSGTRLLAREDKRLLALSLLAEGQTKAEVARVVGVSKTTIYDWAKRFGG